MVPLHTVTAVTEGLRNRLAISGSYESTISHTKGRILTLPKETAGRSGDERKQPGPNHTSTGKLKRQPRSDVFRREDLASLPQPHDWNGDAPRISRRASVGQLIASDREVQRHVQRASFEKSKRHAVHVFGW
jgi:hypothetical protein